MAHQTTLEEFKKQWLELTSEKVCIGMDKSTIWVNPNITSSFKAGYIKRESTSFYQVCDLISEGEIEGLCDRRGNIIYTSVDASKNDDMLKGIYYNNTPVKITGNNKYNFRTALIDARYGVEDQSALPDLTYGLSLRKAYRTINYDVNLVGVAYTETNISPRVNGQIYRYLNGIFTTDSRPVVNANLDFFVHTVTSEHVDELILNFSFFAQRVEGKKGRPYGHYATCLIEVGYEGDLIPLSEGGSVSYMLAGIMGFASGAYARTFVVPLPPPNDERARYIKITRVDREFSPADHKRSKGLKISNISEGVNEKLRYPNSFLVSHIFDASSMSQIPTRAYDAKLMKILVPSNYDPISKKYSGNWNGLFSLKKQWSDNPAWILYDIVTNDRYGLGKFSFEDAFIDKWNLYSIAKYCDELIPSGAKSFHENIAFSVDASSKQFKISLGGSLTFAYLSGLFTVGAEVCLLNLKNSNGADVNKNYKLIIKSVFATSSHYIITFLDDFGEDKVFVDYPYLKKQFLSRNVGLSAKEWLVDNLTNGRNTRTDFYREYGADVSLDSSVTSGEFLVQDVNERQILEPRFTCNMILNQRQEALNIVNTIAALFRGISFWNEGQLFASLDQLKDPVLMFSNANIADGAFSYAGTAKTARTTSVVVRYNDALDDFKPKVEFAEDLASLREFDYNEQEVIAIGCTSPAQAKRIAQWILYTNQTETDMVSFTTGQEGSFLMPGDVINIQDNLKTTKRYGGRLTAVDKLNKSITLDKGVSENVVGQKIYLITPKKNQNSKSLSGLAKEKLKNSDNSGVSDAKIDELRESQITSFTVASVSSGNIVTIQETSNESFNLIVKGSLWIMENDDSTYDIKPIKYRVLGVEEVALNQFTVTAIMYNSSKFNAIERDQNIVNNPSSKTINFDVGSYPEPFAANSITTHLLEDVNGLTENLNDYDAVFTAEVTDEDLNLSVDFSSAFSTYTGNVANIGGYLVEARMLGNKVRFCLDGYDNTSFKVFLGRKDKVKNVGYEVYIYDKQFKLQNLNI